MNIVQSQLKKTAIYNLMFLIALYSPKNDNKQPWNEKIAPQKLLYCKQSFSRFGTHFDDRPKILIYRQIPRNIRILCFF